MIFPPNTGLFTNRPFIRKVFFSFHYQRDISRVNLVRNSWKNKHEHDRAALGFYDGSIWESAKRNGEESLKTLIREGINNTSVTCVLAGNNTYERRWVRYEIARSVIKNNGLLTVHINGMPDLFGSPRFLNGPNPLNYMGVFKNSEKKTYLVEIKNNGEWGWYEDYKQSVLLPVNWTIPERRVIPLSEYCAVYDYSRENGTDNFPMWVHAAAAMANR